MQYKTQFNKVIDFYKYLIYHITMKDKTSFYSKNPLKPSFTINAIYTIHYFKYTKNFRFEGERHNFWELVYIDSGRAHIVDNENEYVLGQGQAFIHKPNSPHTIFTENCFANSVIISFECTNKNLKYLPDGVFCVNEEEKSYLSALVSETSKSYNDRLGDIYLAKMNRKETTVFGSDQIIKNTLELLLISIIRGNNEKNNTSLISIKHGALVDTIINYLHDHISSQQPISLNKLSEYVGYSVSYIKSQFKKKTSKTVIQFFTDLKIEKAKELLIQESYSVSSIADALGFSSIHYFCRIFKKHIGMTPTEYVSSIKTNETL